MAEVMAVVLAAGQGTRMRSDLPKVLHTVAGRPMLARVLDAAAEVGASDVVVVVGRGAGRVRAAFDGRARIVTQAEQLGTGHAVRQAEDAASADARWVLVLYGDSPLMSGRTVAGLLEAARTAGAAMALLSMEVAEPGAYGRVWRDESGAVRGIVEAVDCTPEQRRIREVAAGAFCFDAAWLWPSLRALPVSRTGEYYLTELAAMATRQGRAVAAHLAPDPDDARGVNDRVELAVAEAIARRRVCERLMRQGVTIRDPRTTYVDESVLVERDAVLLPDTHLLGATRIGRGAVVGPGSYLEDATIGAGSRVAYSVVERSEVGEGVRIGPFSHLRPGSRVGEGAEIGNYAELKNATIGPRTKIHHVSYTGDAAYGADVNVGAGTITCNYDAETGTKGRTIVGDGAALGSDTMLVAPRRVGAGAMTGAGAVVTSDIPAGQLAVGVPARVVRPVRRRAASGV